MSQNQKAEAAEEVTLLPRTFTTGYVKDLKLARKLVRDRKSGARKVRTRVVS